MSIQKKFIYKDIPLTILSIKQPWASLIVDGYKNIENRTWKTDSKKWILIHSSSQFDTKKNMKGIKPEVQKVLDQIGEDNWSEYPVSSILGIVYIDKVEPDCDVKKYKWASGPVCWHVKHVYKFKNPIPCKGQLRLWTPNSEVQGDITKELENLDKLIINTNKRIESKESSHSRNYDNNEITDIMSFCKSLNFNILDRLKKNDIQSIKDILNVVNKYYKSKIKNKLAYIVLENYFYYKRPTIKSTYNFWNKSKGYIAIGLDIEGVDKFQNNLLKSVNKWFHSYLPKEDKKLQELDMTNMDDLYNMFDPGWRKTNLTPIQNKIVRNALDGGGNAQFQPYKGWRQSGFGIWNHLRGIDFVLMSVLPVVLSKYHKLYPGEIKSRMVPHIIFKPPSKTGGKLKEHIDSGSFNDMYFRTTYCKTLDDWVINYGIQTLVHLKGARKHEGGQTTLLGPMNVDTFFIILHLIHPKTIHPDMSVPLGGFEKNWNEADGPKFYPWYNKKTLIIINRIINLLRTNKKPNLDSDKEWFSLLKSGQYMSYIMDRIKNVVKEPIKVIKMLPDKDNKPYIIAWPNGFIHGSEPTGKIPRLTLTIPFGPVGNKSESKRILDRLENLTSGKIDKVLEDKTPYHGGTVHKSTKTEIDILPFFKEHYIKNKDLKSIYKYFDI